jgi:hypothetical protein
VSFKFAFKTVNVLGRTNFCINAELLGVLDYGMAAQRISIEKGSIASFASEDVYTHVFV